MLNGDQLRAELDRSPNMRRLRPEVQTLNSVAMPPPPPPEIEWREHIKPFSWPEREGRQPPERRFVVKDWVPAGCVTSFYGPGGVGKSLAVQMLGTATALGRPWLGLETTRGRVLGLFCEDPEDELWRRQVRINELLGVRMVDLVDLHCEGRTGRANELVIPVHGLPAATALLEAVAKATAELKAKLVILDNIAQMFGCNENDRAAVTSFVNRLGGIAVETGAAILLVGHTPKNDVNGSGYSGSTAWNAAVRSRLLLDRVKSDDAEPHLSLRRLKTNYAAGGELEIPLVWRDGVLWPDDPKFMTYGDRLDAQMRQGAVQQSFLSALSALRAQGIAVSASPQARETYAPRYIHTAGLAPDTTMAELKEAMRVLLNSGTIVAGVEIRTRADRKKSFGLGLAAWASKGGQP